MKYATRSVMLVIAMLLPAAVLAEASEATLLRLVAYNIHHGEGTDGKLDLPRIAQVITQLEPDLVALQEVDKEVQRTNRVDQVKELAELTGMQAAFGKFMDYQGGQYGMVILSKYPIRQFTNHRLPPGSEPRSALAATVQLGKSKQELVFVGIHLYQTEEERLAQTARLVEIFKDHTSPIILAGDFNSPPDSKPLNLLNKSWHTPDKGADRLTFSSTNPFREIDYILVRPKDRFEIIESRVIDAPIASDHRPVLLVVRLKQEGQRGNDRP